MRAVLIAALLVVAACGAASAADGPPEIDYGRDICIECGMIIDDPRFAAAYRSADGTDRAFDDLGGLIIHARQSGELNLATVWVHDFESQEWLVADAAHYVPTLGVTSPMGHGILAFGTRAQAERFAAELEGEVIDWSTVKLLPVLDGRLGHHHDADAHTNNQSGEEGHDHDG